jgi:hypothetical protein
MVEEIERKEVVFAGKSAVHTQNQQINNARPKAHFTIEVMKQDFYI